MHHVCIIDADLRARCEVLAQEEVAQGPRQEMSHGPRDHVSLGPMEDVSHVIR